MVIDVVVVMLILGFAVHGYGEGFFRGLGSLVTPILGIIIGLRRCEPLAMLLNGYIQNEVVCRVTSFLVILLAIWLATRLCRRLLAKLVDWRSIPDLDRYVGGILGLAKGTALVWLILAAGLITFPQSVRVVEHSKASMRILSLADRFITPGQEQGEAFAVHDIEASQEQSLALLRQDIRTGDHD